LSEKCRINNYGAKVTIEMKTDKIVISGYFSFELAGLFLFSKRLRK